VAIAVAITVGSVIAASGAAGSVSRQVRGFDGSTLKVAGMGNAAQVGSAQIGAQARIQRFNDTNEIKGVEIEYVGFADDKAEPATSLSEARRLVTQEQVFALVGDTSQFNPSDYFAQNKVPFFGWGYEGAYCSPKVTTQLWGFGYNGCQNNPNPTVVVDFGRQLYDYVSEETGKKQPTVAMISNDLPAGHTTVASNTVAFANAGFKVVFAEANVPPPPGVGDFTPYTQQLMTADDGEPPDAVRCMMSTECLQLWTQMKSGGYEGVFNHSLYTDILVAPFEGSTAIQSNASISSTGIPTLDQMKADVEDFKPGQKIDSPLTSGYASTDMFIKALKKVAKGGKSKITPEAVRNVASKQKWEMKGFSGPVVYPVATNRQQPYCTSLARSDGTKWVTVGEYSCSTKTYPFKK
jgi:ABC-type branched-subunit amino acid transport system substrate-binding protein